MKFRTVAELHRLQIHWGTCVIIFLFSVFSSVRSAVKVKQEQGRSLKGGPPPLDVVFLLERSSEFIIKESVYVSEFSRLILKDYPGSRFGVSYFADFSCSDWYSPGECKKMVKDKEAHTNPEGCYTRGLSLTTKMDQIKKASHSIKSLGGRGPKSGIVALMMAATDKKMGWATGKGTRKRIIFMATDSGTNCCEKSRGIKHEPKGDGTDTCKTIDNVTPEFAGEKLLENDVSVYLLIAKEGSDEGALSNWKYMAERMNIAIEIMNVNMLLTNNKKVYQKFKQFIKDVEDGGFAGQTGVRISGDVEPQKGKQEEDLPVKGGPTPLDVVFLLERSSEFIIKESVYVSEFSRLILKDYPGSRFGVSYFADFSCSDWYSPGECKKMLKDKEAHTNPEGCYTRGLALTRKMDQIKKASHSIKSLGGRGPKSGIAALMMAATDKKMGWEKEKGTRKRIIFMATDSGTNCCEKSRGIKHEPKGDGTDTCKTIDNVTPEFTGEKLLENDVSVYLLIAKEGSDEGALSNWKYMAGRMNIAIEIMNVNMLLTNNKKVYQKFKQFIKDIEDLTAQTGVRTSEDRKPQKGKKIAGMGRSIGLTVDAETSESSTTGGDGGTTDDNDGSTTEGGVENTTEGDENMAESTTEGLEVSTGESTTEGTESNEVSTPNTTSGEEGVTNDMETEPTTEDDETVTADTTDNAVISTTEAGEENDDSTRGGEEDGVTREDVDMDPTTEGGSSESITEIPEDKQEANILSGNNKVTIGRKKGSPLLLRVGVTGGGILPVETNCGDKTKPCAKDIRVILQDGSVTIPKVQIIQSSVVGQGIHNGNKILNKFKNNFSMGGSPWTASGSKPSWAASGSKPSWAASGFKPSWAASGAKPSWTAPGFKKTNAIPNPLKVLLGAKKVKKIAAEPDLGMASTTEVDLSELTTENTQDEPEALDPAEE